jgi:hypothetical protein
VAETPPVLAEHPGVQALSAWLQHDPGVIAHVGTPAILHEDCRPCHIDDDHVSLNLAVDGPKGHARVIAEGHLAGEAWQFDRVDVRGPER